MPKNDDIVCSFCGKAQSEVVQLIAGPGVYICNECVGLCDQILHESMGEAARSKREKSEELPPYLTRPVKSKKVLTNTLSVKTRLKLRCR